MGVTFGIIAGVGTALTLATTGLALSKGAPNTPKVAPPKPPPPVPPPPQALPIPAPPNETEAGKAVAAERRKRVQRFGVAQTLLASPLGGAEGVGTPSGRSLLGGG